MGSSTGNSSVETWECLLDVGGGQIFVQLWNSKNEKLGLSSVLLFYDSLGSVELWRDYPERLARATGREVIAYDRLGFARSSARCSLPCLDFVAVEARQIVPELLRQLGIERVVVCGHSVGGGMAIETAAQHPEKVTALITIAAQTFVEDKTRDGIVEAKVTYADPTVLQRLEKYHGDKARWAVQAWTEVWLDPDFADWNVDSAVAVISAPTLAIHGGGRIRLISAPAAYRASCQRPRAKCCPRWVMCRTARARTYCWKPRQIFC